jgi:hypothetical protein
MIRNLANPFLNPCFVGCASAWLCLATSLCHAEQAKKSLNYYYVDAYIVSLDAKQSLSSYRGREHVSGTPGSAIGSSTPTTKVDIDLNVESGRFFADVTMTNHKKPEDTKKQRIDLTNLRPTSIEVDTDKDGRTYQLNLVPTIKSARIAPKSFQAVTDEMYSLQFHGSRVMLNDKQYIGNMLASGSDYVNVDICGLALIEFSLRQLKDAKPWGTLSDGQIRIANPDGTFITISNVTNGNENRFVTGGPYTVWVRWNKPQATVEEFRGALKAQRELLAKETQEGFPDDTKASVIARIDQELAREPGPWITGCGAHDLRKDEFVREE